MRGYKTIRYRLLPMNQKRMIRHPAISAWSMWESTQARHLIISREPRDAVKMQAIDHARPGPWAVRPPLALVLRNSSCVRTLQAYTAAARNEG